MVDGGVGADRVSMFTHPESSGVGGVEFNFRPHKLTPPPAPVKKSKGGKKNQKYQDV